MGYPNFGKPPNVKSQSQAWNQNTSPTRGSPVASCLPIFQPSWAARLGHFKLDPKRDLLCCSTNLCLLNFVKRCEILLFIAAVTLFTLLSFMFRRHEGPLALWRTDAAVSMTQTYSNDAAVSPKLGWHPMASAQGCRILPFLTTDYRIRAPAPSSSKNPSTPLISRWKLCSLSWIGYEVLCGCSKAGHARHAVLFLQSRAEVN